MLKCWTWISCIQALALIFLMLSLVFTHLHVDCINMLMCHMTILQMNSVYSFCERCDSTSAFYGKGKTKTLNTLEKYSEFISTFKSLGLTWAVSPQMFQQRQKYVCILFGQLHADDVNVARFNLFSIGQYSESTMPCTKEVIVYIG